jgi:drug/metabolite transporter (DMT)-like permease
MNRGIGAGPPHVRPPRLLLAGAFAAVYLVWGSTYLAIRYVVEAIPPFFSAGIRWLVAGAILFAFARRSDRTALTSRVWRSAAIVGLLMLLGGNGLVSWAEQTVPSGPTALLIATAPLWFVLFDWLLFRGPRPGAAVVAGIITGLAGVWLLLGTSRISGAPVPVPGGIALLLASVFWVLGSLYSRRAPLPRSPFLAAGMEMLAAGAGLLIAGALTGEWRRLAPEAVSLRALLALGYLVVFGSFVALTAYMWLLRHASAASVSTYAYVNPVVAVLLGALLADEPLSARILAAAAIIIGSVALISLSGARSRPAAEETSPEVSTASGRSTAAR